MHIKRFVDKVATMESKNNKDLVMPMMDARGLRDELTKLLADLHEKKDSSTQDEQVIKVEITGGSFR